MSEHDAELSEVIGDERRLDENDKGDNDKGHTQVVSMQENVVLGDGIIAEKNICRRMTWKESISGQSISRQTASRGSNPVEETSRGCFNLYASPTAALPGGKREMRMTRKRSMGLKKVQKSKEVPVVEDKSVVFAKIFQGE